MEAADECVAPSMVVRTVVAWLPRCVEALRGTDARKCIAVVVASIEYVAGGRAVVVSFEMLVDVGMGGMLASSTSWDSLLGRCERRCWSV